MIIKPSENTKLYGLSKYFYEISNLYSNHMMPNKILISGKKGLGKSTLAYHLINFFFSNNEEHKYDVKKNIISDKNKSFKLLQNNSHPNFFLIDLIEDKKFIDVSQIRQMLLYTNKSSFNNMPRFILIDNIEYLNKNSINALLKIVEEPNHNVYFILIHNNEKKILPTLKSRCLIFKVNLSFDQSLEITNQLLDNKLFDLLNYDLISYYNTPGELIYLTNFAKEKKINLKEYGLIDFLNFLIDNRYYKKNKDVKNLIINFIELYFLKAYKLSKTKNSLLSFYHIFIKKVNNAERFNLDEENLFLEFKSKLLNG